MVINTLTTPCNSILTCIAGHVDVVQRLLAAGADVSGEGGGGATALHAASEAGAVDVVRALIAADAYIDRADDIGTSPLYATCQHGHFHVAEVLLEAGCHVDGARDSGATPLMIACRQVRLPAVPRRRIVVLITMHLHRPRPT